MDKKSSLRRRYPAQQLRGNGLSQSNGYMVDEVEEDIEPQTSGRANSYKRRSYPLQQLPVDRLPQPKKSTVFEISAPESPRGPQAAEQQHGYMQRRYPAQPGAFPTSIDGDSFVVSRETHAAEAPYATHPMGKHGSTRKRYPSQSGAHPGQYGPASPEINGDTVSEGSQGGSTQQVPSRANSGRRRPYPTQFMPVDKLPRIQPSRDNVLDDSSMQHTPSTNSSEPAVSDRRRLYPTQTLPIDKLATPKPSREVLSMELAAQQIPPAIRAVKNADSYESRQGRTLVVCLDGTGDRFDDDNSNIVHIVSCLKKDDPSQVTYYQPGIGTYDEGQKLSAGFSAAVDMAVGSGLGVHVCDAYRFLMATYRENDKICLFGFSRGAYTARCLAGMIHKVGLLPAHNGAQVPFAYEMYKDESDNGWAMSAEFKKTFSNDVRVYFIGVFDSVASVGFVPRKLPLSSNPACQSGYFRHAMALDEHRAKFKVCRYRKSDQERVARGVIQETNPYRDQDTDVLEVWFAGCHADVGGGAVPNDKRHMLSRIPLRWMIRQCFECNTGILFHAATLAEKGLDVHTLWPYYKQLTRPSVGPPPSLIDKYETGSLEPLSRRSTALENVNGRISSFGPGNPFADDKADHSAEMIPEQVEDCFDAMAPINDQLVEKYWSWAILELWPIKVRVQENGSEEWVKKIRPNLGRYRGVLDKEPLLHWTVRQRIADMDYQLKVRTGRNVAWKTVV